MWGQSWGGMVVTKFITTPSYQNLYDGYVIVNGLINGYENAKALLQFAKERSQEAINQGETNYIDSLIFLNSVTFNPAVYDHNTFILVSQLATELTIPGEPEIPSQEQLRFQNLVREVFPDPIDATRYEANVNSPANMVLVNNSYFMNYTSEYINIQKPGLLIWGENDEATPIFGAIKFKEDLDALNKSLLFKQYDNSWHAPHVDSRNRHYEDVKEFINGL